MTIRPFAGAFLGVALAALSVGAAFAEDVTVSFLTHWPPETVAKLEAAAAAYSKDHPDVKVEVRAVPFGDLLTTLRSQAGQAGGPTITGIYDLWLPELVRDKLVNAAPEANASDVSTNWPKGVASAASVGGSVYGYPNEIDVYALNYNKKLFEEAGIKDAPKTWDEFVAAAEKLTNKDKGQHGFGLINSWAAGVVHPFASLLASNGGALVVDGKPALDSENAAETFALYEKLVKSGASVPEMGTADANTTGPFLDNFVSGKTGMIIMANWWESALKAGMGDKFADIATAPIPVGPKGDGPHSISYSWMTVVSDGASDAEKKAAWDFLAWLNGPTSGEKGASAMGDLLQSMGILPSRSSDVAAFADRLKTPFLAGYVDVLNEARPFPTVLGGQEFTESLQSHIEALEFGKETATDAQKGAQADAAAILEKAAK
ncbi:multiple sugar transport system substrate-binding protein [Kaistia hirudinis]|uniref:Multiple sugar transport system substrate-binding protein n=1 Tax=Kaistia hirudinis TaxID=1293440 RepID=A0A840ALS7_9HYPH|nr:extracellular solute-binding protein [Kaistia hirudinis]MBB3930204.1 multiple sugar transport system substrate-binding protein [Kaistia hirudinis]